MHTEADWRESDRTLNCSPTVCGALAKAPGGVGVGQGTTRNPLALAPGNLVLPGLWKQTQVSQLMALNKEEPLVWPG